MISKQIRASFIAAAYAVRDRAEDINKLNVFPVPDGDTGTNMALTLATVCTEIEALPADASLSKLAAGITHGSLMGARGNSGVITSQILRGLSEGIAEAPQPLDAAGIAAAFRRSVKVAFQAVRKPVEGTILTVLRDVSKAADAAEKQKLDVPAMLDAIVAEAFESTARTPELLPVLKDNGVVDSGAFGFSIFLEAFVNHILGREGHASAADAAMAHVDAKVEIELNDDWEGSEFRYCTEFLFFAETPIDVDATLEFLASMGDCELLVGMHPNHKIHVHTDHPDQVLGHMLLSGQIFNVFIHNMDMEAHERTEKIAEDKAAQAKPRKPLGVVAVAAGSGQAEILKSLGVDVVVEGGQTMNPSTADIANAATECNADAVIVLPNNGNIVMAAQSACKAVDFPMGVVITKSVPQGFSAMFAFDPDASLEENVEAMTEAREAVHDGEVTNAVRDSQAVDGTPIHDGDVIGLSDGKLTHVGSDVTDVTLRLVSDLQQKVHGDTLTILAGCDMDDETFQQILDAIAERNDDLEIDDHRGEQPLYPIILSIE